MIAGIKTAAEAKADALAWQQLNAAPNSIGAKIHALLQELMILQVKNPSALSLVIGGDIRIPTAAVASIQSTWGYVLTTVATGKPPGYSGTISSWVRVTQVSWNI